MDKPKILVLNGPNLNMLGSRDPHIYGTNTLSDLEMRCEQAAKEQSVSVTCRQSNIEGMLIDWLHEAQSEFAGVILNAGAYTHTSIALFDAITACERPVIEVHLSNIFARESFRHHSYISPVALGGIFGFGLESYAFAIAALATHLREKQNI